MLKIIGFIIILIGICMLPSVNGALATGSAVGSDCSITDFKDIANVAGVIAAGTAYFRSTNPQCGVAPNVGAVLQFSAFVSGPSVLGTATTITWSNLGSLVGCTFTSPSQADVTTGGFSSAYEADVTMTSAQCHGIISAVVAVTPAIGGPLNVAIFRAPINIRVESPYTYVCDAPGTVPNSFDPASTTCNDLTTSGTTTLVGIPDTQQEIQAIADALAAGLDVNICPQTAQCYHVLSGSVDTNSTVNVMGNITFNGNFTGSGGNVTDDEPKGFNGSLYVLLMVIAIALMHIAETRRDYVYRMISGGIIILAGFVVIWELERLGFNHVMNGYGLGFALGWMLIHLIWGTYLLIPKNWNDENTGEN